MTQSRPRPIDVLFMAFDIWPEEAAWEWFQGNNDYLDGVSPWHALLAGRTEDVVAALELEKA